MATNKDFKVKNGVTAGGAVTGSNLSGTNTGDQTIALTGDVTGSGTGSFGATLASTGVSAGTYSSVAVDAKGRVTAGAALAGDVTTSAGTATLASVGTSGTKGSASAVPVFVTDTKGRVTSSADTAIQIAETQITDGALFARVADAETITGGWTCNGGWVFNTVVDGVDPVASTNLATKNYVDGVASGLDVKASVKLATTANISLSGTTSIDGSSAVTGMRVLVKNQTTGSQNGIYIASSAGAWTRATDADSSAEVTSGMFTFVEQGTVNGGTGWLLTSAGPFTIGTTPMTFTQFSAAGVVQAGTGLSLSGTTLSLNSTLTGLTSVTSTSFVGALTGNASTVTTNANLTGDVTSSGNATTLATVNSNTGALGSSTAIPTITTNGKGLVTAVTTNAVVAPAGTLSGSTLASGVTGSSLTSVGTLGSLAVTSTNSTGSLVITDTGTSGANIKLAGNGATTPNKYIRSYGGKLSVVNSAYTSEIVSLDDSGNLTVSGNLAVSGTLTAIFPATIVRQNFVATQGQTLVTLSGSYQTGANLLEVYVNGALQILSTDYTETSSTTFTFANALNAGDTVIAISYVVFQAGITVAPAGTLSGTTLASNVVASSLTSFGTTPTLVTPVLGAATGTSMTLSGNDTAAAFVPSGSSVPTNGLFLPTANSVAFSTNSTERVRIDASGKLGIGTTPPATWSSLYSGAALGNAAAYGIAYGSSNGTGFGTGYGQAGFCQNTFFDGGNDRAIGTGAGSQLIQGGGYFLFNTAPSVSAGAAQTMTTVLKIAANGDVTMGSLALASTNSTGTLAITDTGTSGANIKLAGNGATTPNKYVRAQGGKLSVVNSAYTLEIASVDDSGNFVAAGGLTAQAGNVIANAFVPASSTVPSNGLYLAAANTVTLSTNTVERVRIDSAGKLGVGGTPSTFVDVAISGGMLRVGGASGNNMIQAYSSGGTLGLWAGGNSTLYATGALSVNTGVTTGTGAPTGGVTSLQLDASGQMRIMTAGTGLSVKEGSNCKQNVVTLVLGSSVVSNTSVTANSRIFLTIQSLGTVSVPQAIGVTARTAGTSFTITSANATDTSVIAYEIFEPS